MASLLYEEGGFFFGIWGALGLGKRALKIWLTIDDYMSDDFWSGGAIVEVRGASTGLAELQPSKITPLPQQSSLM